MSSKLNSLSLAAAILADGFLDVKLNGTKEHPRVVAREHTRLSLDRRFRPVRIIRARNIWVHLRGAHSGEVPGSLYLRGEDEKHPARRYREIVYEQGTDRVLSFEAR